jgi:hypothetical protein
MAIRAYWEQDGVNRQCWPRSGERVIWYKRISATKILPTEHASLYQELPYRFRTSVEVERCCFRPRHYDHVDVFRPSRSVGAVDLAQVPFQAVAHNRPADLAGYGETNLSTLSFPPGHVTHESPPRPPLAVFKHVQKFALAGEAFPPRKTMWPGHNRLMPSNVMRTAVSGPLRGAAGSLPGRSPSPSASKIRDCVSA